MKTINQDQVRRLQVPTAAAAPATPAIPGELVVIMDTATPYICRATRTNPVDIELTNGNFLFNISLGGGSNSAADISYAGEIPAPYVPFDANLETIIESLLTANDGTRTIAAVDARGYMPFNPSFLPEAFTYEDMGFLQVDTNGNVNGSYKLEFSSTSLAVAEGDALYITNTTPVDGTAPATASNTYVIDTAPSAGLIILNRPIANGSAGYPDGNGFRVYRMRYTQPNIASGSRVTFISSGVIGYPFPKASVTAGSVYTTDGTLAARTWTPAIVQPLEQRYGFSTDAEGLRPSGFMSKTAALTVALTEELEFVYRGHAYTVPPISGIILRDEPIQNLHIVSSHVQYDLTPYPNSYSFQNISNSGFDLVVLFGDEGENPGFTINETWALDLAHVVVSSSEIQSITESIWMSSNGSEETKAGSISEIISGVDVVSGTGNTYNITEGFIRTTYRQVVPFPAQTNPSIRVLWQDDDHRTITFSPDGRYYNILGVNPDPDETNAKHALIPTDNFSVDFLWAYQQPGSALDLVLTKGNVLYTASELAEGVPVVPMNGTGETGYKIVAALVQKGGVDGYVVVANDRDLTGSSEATIIAPDLLTDLTSQTQFHTNRNLTNRVAYNVNLAGGDAEQQGWTYIGTPSVVVDSGRDVLQLEDTSATTNVGLSRPMSVENLKTVFDNGNVIDLTLRIESGQGRLQSSWTGADAPFGNTGEMLLVEFEKSGGDTTFTLGLTTFTFTEDGYYQIRVAIDPRVGNSWGALDFTVTPPSGATNAQTARIADWTLGYSGSISQNILDTGPVANQSNIYLGGWLFTVFTSLPTVQVLEDDVIRNTIFIADGSRDWVFEMPRLTTANQDNIPDSATLTLKLLGDGSYRIRRNATDEISLINGGTDVSGAYDGDTVLEVISNNSSTTDIVAYNVIDITSSGTGVISLPPIAASDVSYDPAQDTSPNPIVATELQAAVTELNAKIQEDVFPVGDYGLRYDRNVSITLTAATFAMSAIEGKLFNVDVTYAGETGIAHGMVTTDQHAVIGIAPTGTFTAPNARYSVITSTTSPDVDIIIKRSNFLLGENRLFTDAELADILLVGEIRRAGSTMVTNVIGPFYGDGTLNEYLRRQPLVIGRSIARNNRNVTIRAGRVVAESLREYNTVANPAVDLEVLVPIAGTNFANLARTFVTDYQWGPGGSYAGNSYWDASDDALATVPANMYVVDTMIARSDSTDVALLKYIGEPMTSAQLQAAIVEDVAVPRDTYIVGKVVHTGTGIYTVVQRNGDVPTVNFDISTEYTATVASGSSWTVPNMTVAEFDRAEFQFNGAHLRHGTEVFRVSDTEISITYDSVINEDFLEVTRPT